MHRCRLPQPLQTVCCHRPKRLGITANMECDRHDCRLRIAVTSFAVLLPIDGVAHGQEILVLPLSNAVAVLCFLFLAFIGRERLVIKLLVFALLFIGIVLSWVLPLLPQTVGELAHYGTSYIFLVGFGVPVATMVLGYTLIRLIRRGRRRDA